MKVKTGLKAGYDAASSLTDELLDLYRSKANEVDATIAAIGDLVSGNPVYDPTAPPRGRGTAYISYLSSKLGLDVATKDMIGGDIQSGSSILKKAATQLERQ